MRQFVTGIWHISAAGAVMLLLLLLPSGAQQGEFTLPLAIISLHFSAHSINILWTYYYLLPSKPEVHINDI
jgi:hypothetical protein